MLVDSHAHITSELYDDISSVVGAARKNNVFKITNCSTSIDDIKEVVKISKTYDMNYAIGVHPEEIKKCDDELKKTIEKYVAENINDKNFIALGEIGLDFYHTKENIEDQIELFDFQLSLAEKYKKSVIVHSREATLKTIEVLKKHNVKGVIHCFSGSYETAMEYVKLGFKLGIGGLVTFKNCKLREYINKIGVENILLETDCPFMTPEPFRKYKNEPKYILDIANYLSNIMNISVDELGKITTENYFKIFDINE